MSGTLPTAIRASGRPPESVDIACANCDRNVETEVIAATLEAQTSLAPMRIATSCAPWLTAFVTWPFRSTIFAPLTESLNRLPLIPGFTASSRE